MPRNARMTGEKWFTCDYSGFEFPVSRRRYQRGFAVADIYYDEPGGQSEGTDPRGINLDEREYPSDGQ
jgi:hypothetical protein